MNEKEAKHKIDNGHIDSFYCKGYLEAIEKAKGLVDFVDDVSRSSCHLHAIRSRKVLAKWEKEK